VVIALTALLLISSVVNTAILWILPQRIQLRVTRIMDGYESEYL